MGLWYRELINAAGSSREVKSSQQNSSAAQTGKQRDSPRSPCEALALLRPDPSTLVARN
jgi:hypothetical protein